MWPRLMKVWSFWGVESSSFSPAWRCLERSRAPCKSNQNSHWISLLFPIVHFSYLAWVARTAPSLISKHGCRAFGVHSIFKWDERQRVNLQGYLRLMPVDWNPKNSWSLNKFICFCFYVMAQQPAKMARSALLKKGFNDLFDNLWSRSKFTWGQPQSLL